MLEVKGDRIYTKSYLKCRKKTGKNELELIEQTKAYTTLSFIDNEYSNDNGKKELDKIKFEYCQEHNIKLYYITYEEIIEDRLEEIFSE